MIAVTITNAKIGTVPNHNPEVAVSTSEAKNLFLFLNPSCLNVRFFSVQIFLMHILQIFFLFSARLSLSVRGKYILFPANLM